MCLRVYVYGFDMCVYVRMFVRVSRGVTESSYSRPRCCGSESEHLEVLKNMALWQTRVNTYLRIYIPCYYFLSFLSFTPSFAHFIEFLQSI